MNIKLRAHHFLCTLCFQGKGYSKKFIDNYYQIINKLNDENTVVTLVEGLDDVCKFCSNNTGGCCKYQMKVQKLDDNVIKLLNLNINEVDTWNGWKYKIKLFITYNKWYEICKICYWEKYGICKAKLIAEKFLDPDEV